MCSVQSLRNYIHTYMNDFIVVDVDLCEYVHILYVCMYICNYVYTHAHANTRYVCVCVRVCVRVRVYMRVYMRACVCNLHT